MSPLRRARTGRRANSASTNPFLAPQGPAAPMPADGDSGDGEGDGGGELVEVAGPPAPTGAPAPAVPVLHLPGGALPGLDRTGPVAVQVCGVHGGAGASTVAAILGQAGLDCGVDLAGVHDLVVPVLLVARTHAHGLDLVRRAAQQWAAGDLAQVRVLGVVLVDDAPRPARALQAQLRTAQRVLPYSWRLAWSEDLRTSPAPPGAADLSAGARRLRRAVLRRAGPLRYDQRPGGKGLTASAGATGPHPCTTHQ